MRDLNRIPVDFDEKLYKKCELLSDQIYSDDFNEAQKQHSFTEKESVDIKKNNVNILYNFLRQRPWWLHSREFVNRRFHSFYTVPKQPDEFGRRGGRVDTPKYLFDTF